MKEEETAQAKASRKSAQFTLTSPDVHLPPEHPPGAPAQRRETHAVGHHADARAQAASRTQCILQESVGSITSARTSF